jgi:hypothetical protein
VPNSRLVPRERERYPAGRRSRARRVGGGEARRVVTRRSSSRWRVNKWRVAFTRVVSPPEAAELGAAVDAVISRGWFCARLPHSRCSSSGPSFFPAAYGRLGNREAGGLSEPDPSAASLPFPGAGWLSDCRAGLFGSCFAADACPSGPRLAGSGHQRRVQLRWEPTC